MTTCRSRRRAGPRGARDRRWPPRPRADKDAALLAMADALVGADRRDPRGQRRGRGARPATAGTAEAMIDRLTLDRGPGRRHGRRRCARSPRCPTRSARWSAARPCPTASSCARSGCRSAWSASSTRRRPNVTADAAGLCLKSGNAVLLRGSSSARATPTPRSSRCCATRSPAAGLPADAVQLRRRDHPRLGQGADAGPRPGRRADPARRRRADPLGGRGVDRAGDRDRRRQLPRLRRRGRRPGRWRWRSCSTPRPSGLSVCNAAESLLVHADVADAFLPLALPALRDGRGDRARRRRGWPRDAGATWSPATEEDCGHGVPVAGHLGGRGRLAGRRRSTHIRRYGTGHTEAIVTELAWPRPARFAAEVDAAAVMVNASTRFTDGGEFGFGAEIGISTQKLHARGPMGLPELTSHQVRRHRRRPHPRLTQADGQALGEAGGRRPAAGADRGQRGVHVERRRRRRSASRRRVRWVSAEPLAGRDAAASRRGRRRPGAARPPSRRRRPADMSRHPVGRAPPGSGPTRRTSSLLVQHGRGAASRRPGTTARCRPARSVAARAPGPRALHRRRP